MKRILILLMIIANVVLLTSCSQETETENQTQNEESANYINVSIAEAIMMANSVGETLSSINLCITGTISSVSNAEYGNMKITDGTDTISVYGLFDKNNVPYKDLENKPVKGDTITIYGPVHCFNGEPEFKNAILVNFTHVKPEVDETYVDATIAEARNADKGAKLVIEGVVAQITYAFGHIPNGFYVVDETGSIYVYGEDAQSVSVGNTVKLGGTKDYYVLEKEQSSAQKYGYKGCCQLKDLILLENNVTSAAFNKDWIQESTVKEILETPVTENITTNIYKVNALIKKVPGSGFTNYYIYDIDGETSSYVYTANSGSDFTWLDEFDGKICTVYLSPINCKSSTSGCIYRFIPILVLNENYTFDVTKAPDYAITYKALDQFNNSYISDPVLEVATSVSSELLGFENVTLTYSSSNTEVVYFAQEEGKMIMHTKDAGNATITITATHNQNSVTKTLEISVAEKAEIETITIAEAIVAEEDSIVTVEGIVVSSLVNKVGFYISDDTGIIAVTCSSDALADVALGNKVVVQGKRIHHKDSDKTHAGQSVIFDSQILANYYGTHEYNTSLFDTTKTLSDLYNLDVNTDYSTTVYVVNAVVEFVEAERYTKCSLKSADGKTTFNLYCSSAKQYSWLKSYAGEEVTLELAVCNWNNKTYYTGCVISVTHNGEKVLNNLNFEN